MNNKKASERALTILTIDEESLPDKETQNKIIEEVCSYYSLNENNSVLRVEIKLLSHRAIYEIMIESYIPDIPIVAALELFTMKLGNIIIYKKVLNYTHVR